MHDVKDDTTLLFGVVKTLCYFDIFQYPLTADEIFLFLQSKGCVSELRRTLDGMKQDNLIYEFHGFYSLRNDASLIPKRLKANHEADRYLPIARARAKFIYKFPFVRAVMASGSLSKKCMDEHSDIDFFVVTSRNRVWMVRLLLTVYKKILLRNSHKQFCINYYVDEDHLSLVDRNVFTATELVTLIPLEGSSIYQQLQRTNALWVSGIFPNFRPQESTPEPTLSLQPKSLVEQFLTILPLAWCEQSMMWVTQLRWARLYRKKMSEKDFDMAFKSDAHTSKAHPRNFQKKVMDLYEAKLLAYTHKLQLPSL